MAVRLRYAPRYSHAELVMRARRWLSSHGCKIVFTDHTMLTDEIPDAIGWTAWGLSTVIECKASRADFRRDAEKWHRQLAGMGNRRYFMASVGVVPIEEVPVGWGLLEVKPKVVRVVQEATARNHGMKNLVEESKLLVRFGSKVADLAESDFGWL